MAHDDRPHAPGFRPPADDPESSDVRRRVVLEAPPEDVWRALTDPDELAAWWGEGTELDVRPGGEGRIVEDGEPVRRARVVEVRPGRSLMLDWWPEDPAVDEPATRVTFELVPCPFGTILHVLECRLLDLSGLDTLASPHPSAIGRLGRLHHGLGTGWGPRALASARA